MSKEIKITRAGYIYIDGVKISERKLTPLYTPPEVPAWALEACQNWNRKNWRMV
jgi:hypothetical protein